jgi:hypothetical protein
MRHCVELARASESTILRAKIAHSQKSPPVASTNLADEAESVFCASCTVTVIGQAQEVFSSIGLTRREEWFSAGSKFDFVQS